MNRYLGSHVSIAGGLENACVHAKKTGSTAIQIFTVNQMRWNSRKIEPAEADSFRKCVSNLGIKTVSHLSYLPNLGSGNAGLREKSISAFVKEVERCEMLGIDFLVFHPGSDKNSTEEETIDRISSSLKKIISLTGENIGVKLAAETTAGQGNQIGYRLEHLAAILKGAGFGSIFGICIDTCHIYAAGYDIGNKYGYDKLIMEFDDMIGLDRLMVLHLNDSLKPLRSRRDRHATIGKGYIPVGTFGLILNDERLAGKPMVLETPGGDEEHRIELEELKKMIRY